MKHDTALRDLALRNRRVYDAHPRQRERVTLGLTTIGYCVYGAAFGGALGFIAFWV